eukprot:4969660-Pleurochrysis_carterae.AAC.1
MKAFDYVDGNMFAPYSRYQAEKRGSLSELHDAMGIADESFSYTGLIQGLPFRINLGVPTVRHEDARAQHELAEVLQRWAREGYGTSSRRVVELGSSQDLIVGLAEPDVASLIQKASRDRRLIDATCRLQKFFRNKRATEAVRCLQKFFRRKIATPRTVERRAHRRTQARVIPDDDPRIAASDAWRLTLEE